MSLSPSVQGVENLWVVEVWAVIERKLLFYARIWKYVRRGEDEFEEKNHIVGNKDVVWQEDRKLWSP